MIPNYSKAKFYLVQHKIVNFQVCKNYKNKIVNIQYLSNRLYMMNYRFHHQTAVLNQVHSQFTFHACWIHRSHVPQSIPFLRLLEIYIYIYIYIYITNKNLNIYNNSHKKHNFISSHFFKSRATHISHYTNYRTALYT